MRKFRGNAPNENEGWQEIGQVVSDDIVWALFEREQRNSHEWRTYKLISTGLCPGKANYWFAKNLRTGQLGYARDLAILRASRPALHEKVEQILSAREGAI